MQEKIVIASDHAGYQMKTYLKELLVKNGYEVLDKGTDSENSVDYPDYAQKLARSIYNQEASKGVLICGTGIGMSIAVNRFPFIRGALVFTPEMAALSRQHNDANVLVLGARTTSIETASKALQQFLVTPFEGGRHEPRVNKLKEVNNDFRK